MTLAKPFRDSNPEAEAQYKALLRSLRRTKGFGIVFVQCTPSEATRLIASVREDLPQKNIGVLNLPEPIDNLYQLVAARPDRESLNILFIQGIEKSLEPYIKPGYGGEGDYYKLDTVPRILSHLNQQRENFRDHFSNLCFVFIVPRFALKYFIQRAPDFFDWQSRVSVFPVEPDLLEQASSRILLDGDYDEYLALTPPQRNQKLLEIQELLQEKHQPDHRKADLFFRQGNLFIAFQDYEAAVASYDQVLAIEPDDHEALNNKGIALAALGHIGAAIECYDHALAIKPINYDAMNNRGNALAALGRNEEAIESYDQAITIKPDYHRAWNNRGNALAALGRNEEAIESYDQAITIKPNYHEAWSNRGVALDNLGCKKKAIESYDKAIKIKPDYYRAWDNRGDVLRELEQYQEAASSHSKALEINPDYHSAWHGKGLALMRLEQFDQAIESFNRAVELKSDDAGILYDQSCCYGLQGNIEAAIQVLQQAVDLDAKYREMAKTDSDFDNIRDDERFQTLLQR
jgi:tetratricopeptide (TPR) repeat protein